MDEEILLVRQFEEQRPHLRAVAYRMLGSLAEADDAVQETWIRLNRADTTVVANLCGWLTTVVARVCLDQLRSRKAKREDPLVEHPPQPARTADAADPEAEAELADSVGLAMLVVLETLGPAERLAFVLHDMFAVPFDDIASIVGRTPTATRQLASRARSRVQGKGSVTDPDRDRQREVVEAFLAAARGGDFEGLLAVLDPDIVLRSEDAAGVLSIVRGAHAVASNARRFSSGAAWARPAVIDGRVGFIVAPHGRLRVALRFTITDGLVVAIESIANPTHLDRLQLAVLDD